MAAVAAARSGAFVVGPDAPHCRSRWTAWGAQPEGTPPVLAWRAAQEPTSPVLPQSVVAVDPAYVGNLLRLCKFSKHLEPGQLTQLARLMSLEAFEDGEEVVREGEEGDCFYLLVDGTAEAYVHQPDGGEVRVKVYDTPGSYFGELALLLKNTKRRATVRAKGRTTLLSLTRADFDRTLKGLREPLLRSAAVRPADKALRWAQELEDSRLLAPLERQLGLGGEQRQQLLLASLFLAAGTAFYTWSGFDELEQTTPAAGFYYAVQAGLAVGFGVLHPRSEAAPFVTAAFVLGGGVLLANVLSRAVADLVQEVTTDKQDSSQGSRQRRKELVQSLVPLSIWWAVGVAFARLREGMSWGDAVLFALSCTSTLGLQGVRTFDDGTLLFCASYCLFGVPLYLTTLGQFSLFVASEVIEVRRSTIRNRATAISEACDEEVLLDLFAVFDEDQTGRIEIDEVPRVLRFLAANKDLEVTAEDIDFILEEFGGSSETGISQADFIRGLRRWRATSDPEGSG